MARRLSGGRSGTGSIRRAACGAHGAVGHGPLDRGARRGGLQSPSRVLVFCGQSLLRRAAAWCELHELPQMVLEAAAPRWRPAAPVRQTALDSSWPRPARGQGRRRRPFRPRQASLGSRGRTSLTLDRGRQPGSCIARRRSSVLPSQPPSLRRRQACVAARSLVLTPPTHHQQPHQARPSAPAQSGTIIRPLATAQRRAHIQVLHRHRTSRREDSTHLPPAASAPQVGRRAKVVADARNDSARRAREERHQVVCVTPARSNN